MGIVDQVKFLGYCSYEELPAIYKGAACLVFPSLFEGFGMPILEAMTVGCPVICRDAVCRKSLGMRRYSLTLRSDEEISSCLNSILTSSSVRKNLINLGHQQASKFLWEKFAEQIIQELTRIQSNAIN